MRKTVLLCALVLLALPAAALAGRNAPGDGTLSVKDGRGLVVLSIRGALIMRCSTCDVLITDPAPGDGNDPVSFGDDFQNKLSETSTLYRNRDKSDMRIRVIGGRFTARITGRDLNISAVGKGSVTLLADPVAEFPGTYSIDDVGAAPLPALRMKLPLGQTG
jgi:hypothetical protein